MALITWARADLEMEDRNIPTSCFCLVSEQK